MLIMQIGWSVAIWPAVEHGSGQKNFSICWTWPLSTVTSFYLHVVGRKFHTDFRLTLIQMLVRSGHEPRPCMPVGGPAPTSANIGRLDTRHVTISTGLAATPSSGVVACVQWGAWRGPCYSNVSSVTWHFVWTEVVLKITTKNHPEDIFSFVVRANLWSLDHI